MRLVGTILMFVGIGAATIDGSDLEIAMSVIALGAFLSLVLGDARKKKP